MKSSLGWTWVLVVLTLIGLGPLAPIWGAPGTVIVAVKAGPTATVAKVPTKNLRMASDQLESAVMALLFDNGRVTSSLEPILTETPAGLALTPDETTYCHDEAQKAQATALVIVSLETGPPRGPVPPQVLRIQVTLVPLGATANPGETWTYENPTGDLKTLAKTLGNIPRKLGP